MPSTTPNFDLPYPDGTDAPCDFAQQWCDFAAAVNAVLDGFQESIDRIYPTVPAAGFRATVSRTYDSLQSTTMRFDSVAFDTAGWIDFDANDHGITIKRGGVYNDHASFIVDPDGVNSYWRITTQEQFPTTAISTGVYQEILDRGVGGQRVGADVFNLKTHSFESETYATIAIAIANYTVTNGYLSAWWFADTVRAS